jgi:predicted DNA-binding transcriptional regulator AlpA
VTTLVAEASDGKGQEDILLDAQAVSEMLGVSKRWVEKAGYGGLLPSVKIGAFRRYRRQDILRWIERQATAGRTAW